MISLFDHSISFPCIYWIMKSKGWILVRSSWKMQMRLNLLRVPAVPLSSNFEILDDLARGKVRNRVILKQTKPSIENTVDRRVSRARHRLSASTSTGWTVGTWRSGSTWMRSERKSVREGEWRNMYIWSI